MGTDLLHHSKIKNQKGFTLTEVLIVVGITGMMVLANITFLSKFLENAKKVENESWDEAELAITNRRFANMISRATGGFNRLVIKDVSGQNFYDYFPDMPQSSFVGVEKTRQINLSAGAATDTRSTFYLLVSEEDQFPGINMDPIHAYNEDVTPTDMSIDGTVAYQGLNGLSSFGGNAHLMSQVFQTRWAANEMFLLTSPVYLRPILANGTINLKTAPRMPSYLGQVIEADLAPFASTTDLGIMNNHPQTGQNYTSPDIYFRTLPPVGGASPFVKVEAVRMIRLEFKTNGTYPAGYGDLVMSKWLGGQYVGNEIVIRKAKQVRLKRDSVTMPLITLEVDK